MIGVTVVIDDKEYPEIPRGVKKTFADISALKLSMILVTLLIVVALLTSIRLDFEISADGSKHVSIDFAHEQTVEPVERDTPAPIDDETDKLYKANLKVDLAQNLFSQKKWKEVIANCNAALELNPNNTWAYSLRGGAYLNMREFRRALEDFDKAIELDDRNDTAYCGRGNVYEYLNEREKAIADFTRAIELKPTAPEPYYYRGVSYTNSGDSKRGKTDMTKAEALGFRPPK